MRNILDFFRAFLLTAATTAFTLTGCSDSTSNDTDNTDNSNNEIKSFNFQVSVLIYDELTDNFILTDATMDISIGDKSYNYSLTNTTNVLSINDIAGDYFISIKKTGYQDYVATYTDIQMKAFSDEPLLVKLKKETTVMPNLVAEYMFNNNTEDTSGNKNNGSVHGTFSTAADRHGNEKSAFNFVGKFLMAGFII